MLRIVLTTVTLLMPAMAVEASVRYIDENGILVIADTIPTWLVEKGHGYEILDDDGQVVKEILSREEQARRDALLSKQERRERAAQAQRERDLELVRRYSSCADVEFARKRRLEAIDGDITRLRTDIERYRLNKRDAEERAAALERSGQVVSASVIESMNAYRLRIEQSRANIEARRAEKSEINAQFDQDLERLRLLYNGCAEGGSPEVADAASG